MKKRNVGLSIVLSLVTCGIYAIYWMYTITNDVHEVTGRQTTASGGMVILYGLITCGIYFFYWMYKMGESLAEAKEKRGMHVDNNACFLYMVLTLFMLALVSYALIQSSINDIIDFDENNTGAVRLTK
ncbi:MAG: DUF4234 domain-containing protein [Selenomonadaceae bacterium]|nr:DUF4234 domain-containing protein [Selenomonadaceae bacterium]